MIVFRIQQIREKKNVTAYKLAKDLGISRSYLSELENNKRKVSTVVSNKGQTITSNKPTLTDDEKRVAFNMGMTEAEYLKWRQ